MIANIYAGHQNLIDTRFKVKDDHFKNILLISGGVLFLALMAQISIPLPFTPVPITGQSLGVLLIGAAFGAKRAFLTTLSYITLGSAGLPIFSAASFGLSKLIGPTGGYLIGFIIAATVMGLLSELKKDRNLKNALLMFTLGHAIIFATGLTWLSFFVGAKSVFALGFIPFIPGLIIKTILASFILPALWKNIK